MNLQLKYRIIKRLALGLAVAMAFELLAPPAAYALTGGPTQPEVQSFNPAGTSDMVDLFSGDFSYNLPLFELPGPNGGYPFNLAYNSGIGMDQEASWVGLGWNLNPGVISRQMRGLPDEFAGDLVNVEQDMKDDVTVEVTGGANLEVFGADKDKVSIIDSMKLDLSLRYNTYAGFGYSLNFGIPAPYNIMGGSLDLSLDSDGGVGLQPKLSLAGKMKDTKLQYNLGIGYNSNAGLTGINLGGDISTKIKKKSFAARGNSNLSFARPAYSPFVSLQKVGVSGALNFKFGSGAVGIFTNGRLSGSISAEGIPDKNQDIAAFGYMNLEGAGEEDMTDFNREKDGPIRRNSPNLGAPSLTYDIYSLSGQGLGGSFRAFRNDIGVIHDRKQGSYFSSLNAGVEPGAPHVGLNLGVGFRLQEQGKWKKKNEIEDDSNFLFTDGGDSLGATYEPWYFKVHGEMAPNPINDLSYMAWTQPVKMGLNKNYADFPHVQYKAKKTLTGKNGYGIKDLRAKYEQDEEREARQTAIQYIKKSDLGSDQDGLGEYVVKTYPSVSTEWNASGNQPVKYSRPGEDHHLAGITATRPDGMRYVYGLPAYNKKQVECQFTVDGAGQTCTPLIEIPKDNNGDIDYKANNTDRYYNRKEIPEYAHSYLLTSVLGQDYVDADSTVGPSDGDFGFWVKFNYVKTDDDYQWRAPFTGANYEPGVPALRNDDKGMYTWGEKEMWYLATAETKTHIAEFYLSSRADARGAFDELQNPNDVSILGGSSYKLDSIALFSKAERQNSSGITQTNATPIQKVHFRYGYDLCKGIQNTSQANFGKLTLEEVWFTQESNSRGELNKYRFDYNEDQPVENPDYNSYAQDRWGNYRPLQDSLGQGVDSCKYQQFPYVDPLVERDTLNRWSAVWNLKKVTLPTGGVMQIDYEADDYGYVQNKIAANMLPISGFVVDANSEVYQANYDSGAYVIDSNRRVFFDLIRPTSDTDELDAYFEGIDQLYFKARMDLKKSGDILEDYVSGYLKIEPGNWGFDPSSDSGGMYSRGWFILEKPDNPKWEKYHPLALAAWQHLRANVPQLVVVPSLNVKGKVENGATIDRIRSLLSIGPEIAKIFRGYYKHADTERWAQSVDLDEAWIRLSHPLKAKVGGGCRVKQITLTDKWYDQTGGTADSLVVGTVYDYSQFSLKEGVGTDALMSSGVAQYEPFLGGDENPFRRAEEFTESILLRSDNNLFFEHPINEGYFPGAMVGYSKVTVKSLATENTLKNLPTQTPTTGAAVHEFYTAKDFPTLVDQTPITNEPFHLPIPIPFIGGLTYSDITASQGYSIVLNDMHGKPKSVSNYGQDRNGRLMEPAMSWVKYLYHSEEVLETGKAPYQKLTNVLPVMRYDVDPSDYSKSDIEDRVMGQEHEFILEMRQSVSNSYSAGVDFNVESDILGIFPWPSYSQSKSRVRTSVTNKIIYQSGIMSGMRAWNEGSLVKTDHVYYDELTGAPLLQTVTNNYEDPIYSYSYPARWAYPGMGAAYENIGVEFSNIDVGAVQAITQDSRGYFTLSATTGSMDEFMYPGDEVLMSGPYSAPLKAWYQGRDETGKHKFWSDFSVNTSSEVDFLIVRSGKRNLLGAMALQIAALKDPTRHRDELICYRDFVNPGAVIDSIWSDTLIVSDTLLDPCVDDLLTAMNYALQDTFYEVHFSVFPANLLDICSSCQVHYGFFQSNGEFLIRQTVQEVCCNFAFFDDQGTKYITSDIASISNPRWVSGSGVTIPSGWNYNHCQVDLFLNNGSGPISAWLHSEDLTGGSVDCSLPYSVNTRTFVDFQSTQTNMSYSDVQQDTMLLLDSILSASATTFSDGWAHDFSDVRFEKGSSAYQLDKLSDKDVFANGEKGIWRGKGSYVYVEDRRQSLDLNLREDGTFDDMPMFNFRSLLTDYCADQWRHVNEITRYNPFSYEIENRDVLNVKSTALYGYHGKLPIAVAANSAKGEIGFEGFEEYSSGASVNGLNTPTGNLDFYNSYTETVPPLSYPAVLNGYSNDAAYASGFVAGYDSLKLQAQSHGGLFTPTWYYVAPDSLREKSAGSNDFLTLGKPSFGGTDAVYWRGNTGRKDMYLPMATADQNKLSRVDFTDEKAHSGQISMKLDSGEVSFPQNRLQPEEGKAYVLQLWVSRANEVAPFYQSKSINPADHIGVWLDFYDSDSALISSTNVFEPEGRIIEGWQKIEGEFTPPTGTVKLAITLRAGEDFAGAKAAYFDDIRLQPLKSQMKTYVYDLGDYRLQAVLDDDNFATFYRYDEAGALYLIQKETVEGIRTIQESRTFLEE